MKTNHNIFFAAQSAKAIRLLKSYIGLSLLKNIRVVCDCLCFQSDLKWMIVRAYSLNYGLKTLIFTPNGTNVPLTIRYFL